MNWEMIGSVVGIICGFTFAHDFGMLYADFVGDMEMIMSLSRLAMFTV
jgi:hypothetical protein